VLRVSSVPITELSPFTLSPKFQLFSRYPKGVPRSIITLLSNDTIPICTIHFDFVKPPFLIMSIPTKPEVAYLPLPTLCKVPTCPLNQAGIHHYVGIYKQDDVSPARGFFSVLFGYISLFSPFRKPESEKG